jgi:ferredoxin
MTAVWQVSVEPSRCRGSGMCTVIAPGSFTMAAAGRSAATAPVVAADGAILDAALSCPLEAITVTDLGSGKRLAPED